MDPLPSVLASASWAEPVAEALRAAPDPARAAAQAERLLEAVPRAALEAAASAHPERLARVLGALCGSAPFFVSHLVRHPDWLLELLADDLERPLDAEALERELDAALAAEGDPAAERLLRETKYRQLARITVRDCCEDLVPLESSGQTLADISRLADVLLGRALGVARARLSARIGPLRWSGGDAGFVVLGLGKLGGEELNFSSDVDLVYVHEAAESEPGDGEHLAPQAWFTSLAHELRKLVADVTPDGFLYRIDLDLRPEGSQGPLVLSEQALATYHETVAHTWEKVAFMKARPVAGDLELGWRVIRAIAPMIYQASMDYAAVQKIRSLKDRIGRERGSAGGDFDVKLDPGGIRDVEFAAQALQLLHGGRIPQLRDRSTQRALLALADVKLLPRGAAESLLRSYWFLRRVENRLQMWEERQTHRVPREPVALARLARAMGFGGAAAAEDFAAALEAERENIARFSASFLAEGGNEAILELFARHQPKLLVSPATRSMMETLAEQLARAIESSPDPELALNNLDRFIEGVGGRRFYYELLLDRPELVPRLAALFAGSRFLSNQLARHPRLIEPVFDHPERMLLFRQELHEDLAAIREALAAEGHEETECELDALRMFHHRQVMNVGLLDVGEKVSRREAEVALTEIAEVTLCEALDVASAELERAGRVPAAAGEGAFLVVGMGKLASRELGYGSDLDLIFLYELPESADALEAQPYFAHLTQRLISILQTPTTQGACYEIDARLRPSGRQGTLVTSLASFRRYHDAEAQAWERQVLLRARPVAGDAALGQAFEALRREILRRPHPDELADEIHRIRLRMETELAGETRERRDLKAGRGGLLDVENAVQYLQLRHGRDHEELLEVDRIEGHIAHLAKLGILDPHRASVLLDGWEFLQRLGSRLRIVENRSISDLDERKGDLDGLARRLGYLADGRESGPRRALLRDYAAHTEAIRRAYLEILGVEAATDLTDA